MNTIKWLDIFDKYNTQEIITGKVLKKVPGGFTVDVFGASGFLPWSQVPQELKNRESDTIDSETNFKILKINAFCNNIVVSRADLLEQEKEDAYHDAIKDIHVGDVFNAVVKNIVSFGVFVTINGKIDGLIPSKELTWQFVSDINQIISVNDNIKVKVKSIDEDAHRISLSHKDCVPSPWESMDTSIYYRNAEIDVIVARVNDNGVMVALKNGCQGFLPSKEVSWDEESVDLYSMFSIGEHLQVKLISIDIATQKIYVSLRQLQDKPVGFIPVGKRLYCSIDHETKDGFYLHSSKRIPVFLPKTEISWLKKYDINEYISGYNKLQVVIIANARGNKPVLASIKQMYPDPMNAYTPNSIHKGYVSGELPKVYFVNFKDGLTGLILKETLNGAPLKKGTEIHTKVLKLDKENRRIILRLHKESEFTGNDIMDMLNLKPSRVVGTLKNMLSSAVESGEIDTSFEAGAAFIKRKAKEVL